MRTLLKVSTALLLAALSTCTTSPSYASKSKGFVFYRVPSIDLVAVTGNNASLELRNLLKPVQHHTIVDVFLCLSFINLSLFTGKLRLVLVRLWQGGRGNKPFIRQIPCAVGFSGFEPPCRPIFGANLKKSLPFEKV